MTVIPLGVFSCFVCTLAGLQADHQLSHPVGCMKPAEEEEDVLEALGTLASFARCALDSRPTQGHSMLRMSIWTCA
jgi:hypothetical protein